MYIVTQTRNINNITAPKESIQTLSWMKRGGGCLAGSVAVPRGGK